MDLGTYIWRPVNREKALFLNFANCELCDKLLINISARRRYYTDLANGGGTSEEESPQ